MAIRKYKPITSGTRHMSTLVNEEITKNTPEKKLIVTKKKTGGRNNQGKITVRHIGGGVKRKYRIIDFKRNKDNIVGKVASIEYDPNRSANIALINYADGEKRYIIAPLGLKTGSNIVSGDSVDIKVGNALPIMNIPVGTVVHNIELNPGKIRDIRIDNKEKREAGYDSYTEKGTVTIKSVTEDLYVYSANELALAITGSEETSFDTTNLESLLEKVDCTDSTNEALCNRTNNFNDLALSKKDEYIDALKKLNDNELRPKSSKNVNGGIKKLKKTKHSKEIHKKNTRGCVTSKNRNNNHISNFTNVLNNIKSKLGRYISIRSDKKSKIKKSRLSQDNKTDKLKTNSIIKKHKKTNSNDYKIINVGESPFQNIMSKLDTKTTSFEDNSSFIDNKNKMKSTRKESNINSKFKESIKNLKKDSNGRRKFKYITDGKLKHKCFEELKIKVNSKPNKKSLIEPIRSQFMNSLQKKVGFNFEENKKSFYKNNALSKLSLVKKMKSKSKKDCTEYVDNSDDDGLFYKNVKGSYNIKDKNISYFNSKKIVQ